MKQVINDVSCETKSTIFLSYVRAIDHLEARNKWIELRNELMTHITRWMRCEREQLSRSGGHLIN